MSNVYRIAMSLVAHNHAGSVLSAIAGQLLHVHGLVNQTNAAMARMQLGLAGGVAMFAGKQMVDGYVKIVDQGAKFVGIQNQMTAQGWKQKELAEAVAKSWEITAKYQSMGAAEVLEMQKEISPALGSREEAMHLAEQMAKLHVSLQGTLGMEGGSKFHTAIRDAIRGGELSGNVLHHERFAVFMDGLARSLKAFGGTVTPSDIFQAIKYGRASALNWSDEFMVQKLPTLVQELGGSSTGTAMMSIYQSLVGGAMTGRSIAEFERLGLVDRTKINPNNLTPEGRIKKMSPGGIIGTDTFLSDPHKFAWEYLVPAMLKDGIVTQAGIDAIQRGELKDGGIGEAARKAITKEIALLFGNRTAQGMMDTLVLQDKKIHRDANMVVGAMGLDEGAKFYSEQDYGIAKGQLHEQWNNLITALGAPEVQSATRILHGLTDAITGLSQTVTAHPVVASALMNGLLFGGVSTILLGLGAIAFAVLGPMGLLIVGLGMLATVVASFAASHWDKISDWWNGRAEYIDKKGGFHARKEGVQDRASAAVSKAQTDVQKLKNFLSSTSSAIGDAASKVWEAMKQIGGRLADAIMSIPGMVMGAIASMASAIGNAIAGALGGLSIGGGKPGSASRGAFGPGSGIQKQNYVPNGGRGGSVQHASIINLDGRRLATVVTEHQVRSSRMVQSAASFDGRAHPTPVDYSHA